MTEIKKVPGGGDAGPKLDSQKNSSTTSDAEQAPRAMLPPAEIAENSSQAKKTVEWFEMAERAGFVELFKTPGGEPFVSTDIFGPVETFPLDSEKFQNLVRREYRKMYSGILGSHGLTTGLAHIRSSIKKTLPVHIRVAHFEDSVYVDLGSRQVVKIDAKGWTIEQKVPVKFWRPPGFLNLPVPSSSGSLEQLRSFINVDEAGWQRIVAFLLSSFASGPQLVLSLIGAKGTAKSTAARLIQRVLDPSAAEVCLLPESVQDLMLCYQNQFLAVFDNVSSLSAALSDAMCGAATGTARRQRLLYSNSLEHIIRVRKPQILTSIRDVVNAPDLAERTLKIDLQIVQKRRTEKEINEKYVEALPGILGALYDVIAGALGCVNDIDENVDLPRMADAARFLIACEVSLGWEPGTVVTMFKDDAERRAGDICDNDPFVELLIGAVASHGNSWPVAKADDVINAVENLANKNGMRHNRLPDTGKALSDRIRKYTQEFKDLGLEVIRTRTADGRYWSFRIVKEDSKIIHGNADPDIWSDLATATRCQS